MPSRIWTGPRRFIAVEWHPAELHRRVAFIVTNMSRPAKRVVALYDKRGTYTQWIKKDKDAFRLEYLFASSPTTNTAGANAGGTGGTNPVRGGPGHPGCSRRRELQVLRGREGLTGPKMRNIFTAPAHSRQRFQVSCFCLANASTMAFEQAFREAQPRCG
jgi:hypothetical protein